jgi:hypothetical protein
MKQRTRILVGVGVLVLIVLVVMGVELLRRRATVPPAVTHGQNAPVVTLVPGSIPVYVDGQLTAGFSPDGLSQLKKVSFVEAAEGVTQDGWLVREVLLLYLQPDQFKPDTQIIVSSASRGKTAQLTWAEISAEENMVMFDLANRGTLKLASKLEKLDTRDEWVQDVDKIEVIHRKVE